jgi:HK97 family phage major capsid protein
MLTAKSIEKMRFAEVPAGLTLTPAQARSRLRQDGTEVQEVICSKERFGTVVEARTWVGDHGFRTEKVDVTDDAFRFRQFDPGEGKEGALADGETFATITLDRGVKAIVCKRGERTAEQVVAEAFPEGMRYADFAMHARPVTLSEVRKHVVGLTRAEEEEEEDGKPPKYRLYEVAISSETEVERWFGIEILGHAEGEVDMERLLRGAAVLVNHYGDQVGVVVPGSARVDDDKVLRGYLRFSRSVRGREVEDDVEQEIRTSISVGYMVKAVKLVEVREVTDGDGRKATVDVYRATRWQPAEVSLVSVPADVTVGVGRSEKAAEPPEEGTMKKVRDDKGNVVEVADTDQRPAVTAGATGERDKAIGEILDICENNGIEAKEARKWIVEGLTVEQVGHRIVTARKTTGEGQPSAEALAAVPDKARRRYRYTRAILGAARQREGTGKLDGVEAEIAQELERNIDPSFKKADGLLVPMDLRSEEDRWREWEVRRQMQTRALDSKTAGRGPETIFEEPGELIEILRQASVAARMGARMLGGLTAPVAFPKHTGRLSAFWVGENPASDVTASDLGFGIVNLSPKTIQATTAFSRQFLVQTSIDAEGLVRSELAEEHGLLLDRTVFHGEGAAGEPTGIYQAPDVNVRAAGGVPDYADVVDLIGLVADDNALAGTLGWVTTPLMAAKLRQIPEHATGTMANWIWMGTFLEGLMAGYRAVASNQISKTMTGSADTGGAEHGAIFGNWREVLIGMFAAMEIIVDPFAQKKKGLIEVTSFQMADIVLRHGESFGKWTGATV